MHDIVFTGADHMKLKCPSGTDGPGDVIIGNSCLRHVIFLIVVFLVSCCTIVVLVSNLLLWQYFHTHLRYITLIVCLYSFPEGIMLSGYT